MSAHAEVFAGKCFDGLAAPRTLMASLAVEHAGRASRVLEIGCGTGSLCLELAQRLPAACISGLDISQPNIEAARARCPDELAGRVRFACADIASFEGGPYDAVVSDSTLHLVGMPGHEVLSRVGGLLAPGGVLVASMPYDGPFNRMLWALRRVLKACQGPLLEAGLLAAARVVYPRCDRAFIQQRIAYMYLQPYCRDGAMLRAAAGGCGLQLINWGRMPRSSIAQSRHNYLVFAKGGRAG